MSVGWSFRAFFALTARAMLRPMGQDDQSGVEKVLVEINFECDLLHICPVISRIVGFPELNLLVQSLEIRYLGHLQRAGAATGSDLPQLYPTAVIGQMNRPVALLFHPNRCRWAKSRAPRAHLRSHIREQLGIVCLFCLRQKSAFEPVFEALVDLQRS